MHLAAVAIGSLVVRPVGETVSSAVVVFQWREEQAAVGSCGVGACRLGALQITVASGSSNVSLQPPTARSRRFSSGDDAGICSLSSTHGWARTATGSCMVDVAAVCRARRSPGKRQPRSRAPNEARPSRPRAGNAASGRQIPASGIGLIVAPLGPMALANCGAGRHRAARISAGSTPGSSPRLVARSRRGCGARSITWIAPRPPGRLIFDRGLSAHRRAFLGPAFARQRLSVLRPRRPLHQRGAASIVRAVVLAHRARHLIEPLVQRRRRRSASTLPPDLGHPVLAGRTSMVAIVRSRPPRHRLGAAQRIRIHLGRSSPVDQPGTICHVATACSQPGGPVVPAPVDRPSPPRRHPVIKCGAIR